MESREQMMEDFAASVRAIENYARPLKRIICGLSAALIVSNLIWVTIVFSKF